MRTSPKTGGSRREFFRAAARYGLGGLLLAAAGLAAHKPGARGEKCRNQGICGGCGVLANCGLPQAISARAARGGA